MKLNSTTFCVTDHALLRFRERIATQGNAKVDEVIEAVRKSRFLSSNDPLPFRLTRKDRSTYCFNDQLQALFVLDSGGIDVQFRIVTVYSPQDDPRPAAGCRPVAKPEQPEVVRLEFDSDKEERDWLIAKKIELEGTLNKIPRRYEYAQELKTQLSLIETRLLLLKDRKKEFNSAKEEREYLVAEKNNLEFMLRGRSKKNEYAKKIKVRISQIEERLRQLKADCGKEYRAAWNRIALKENTATQTQTLVQKA